VGGGLKKGARKICKPQRREEILHAVIHIPPGEKFLLYQQALERGNRFFFDSLLKVQSEPALGFLSVLIAKCFDCYSYLVGTFECFWQSTESDN
jgi:hypothetical protein